MTPEASHIQITNGFTRDYLKNKVHRRQINIKMWAKKKTQSCE